MKYLKNESGQAIFELITFLPILLILFTLFISIGSSINSSINQQKATRNYFFYLTKNNSYIPDKTDLEKFRQGGNSIISFTWVGWKEKWMPGTKQALAPCFRLNTLPGDSFDENCIDRTTKKETRYIRVFTAFGVCGESYALDQNDHFAANFNQEKVGHCTAQAQ